MKLNLFSQKILILTLILAVFGGSIWIARRDTPLTHPTRSGSSSSSAPTRAAAPRSGPVTGQPRLETTDRASAGPWTPVTREPALVAFAEWFDVYAATADSAKKISMESAGVELAQKRREALAELIRQDPKQAV